MKASHMTVLSKLLPPSCATDAALAASQLPRATMMRVNFIPGVRQRLGWRGMRACPRAPMSLTARIEAADGVFGLHPAGEILDGEVGIATFSLHYFPQVDEDVINNFSIAAGLAVYAEDYMAQIKDFSVHDTLSSLFCIADIELRYTPQGFISLSLVAPEHDRIIAVDGIRADGASSGAMLTAPGDAEQDLPCFELAFPFFEILAASFSYVFEAVPQRISRCRTAYQARYHANGGQSWSAADRGNALWALRLGWKLNPQAASAAEALMDAPIDEQEWVDVPTPVDTYQGARWLTPAVPGARHSMDKSTMGIEERPKLIVLTGFLGAGKTSFLSHFIEYQAARNLFVAIIQNEIGEKGLDARLLGQHYAVEEIDEGCVCCTLIDNLTAAINQICQNYQPDFIIVETTGLANPANLLSELSELQDRLEFSSVTCVLDALNADKALSDYAILADQIRVSDSIVINKTDLAQAAAVDALEHKVRQLNSFASLHRTCHGDISPRELYGVNLEGLHNPQIAEPCGCSADGHNHHCTTHHHYGIRSELWRPTAPVDRRALEAFLLDLPPHVLRVKGLLRLDGDTGLSVCQHVPDCVQITPYRGQDNPSEFLVFIGEKLEQILPLVDGAVLSHKIYA